MNNTKVRIEDTVPLQKSCLMVEYGEFEYDAGQLLGSSGIKLLLRGTYRSTDGVRTDALLVMFEHNCSASYAHEIEILSKAHLMGVGPQLLCPYVPLANGRMGLIEEDVGISLEAAIAGVGIPFYGNETHAPLPLHSVGSNERLLEAKKIMFDVLVQMNSLHTNGIFHRDLRAANVCVRRFGDRPQDLRATLVDFDLSTQKDDAVITYDNQPFLHLFETLPSCQGLPCNVVPTPLEIDAAYLSALNWEVATGKPIETATAKTLTDSQGDWPIFGYHGGTNPYFARKINKELDIDALASDLGLMPVNSNTFPEPADLAIAQRLQHGGFIDSCDVARIRLSHPEGAVFDAIEELSRKSYTTYVSQVISNGLAVSYKRFEKQPITLIESTKEQVRDIPNKVFALGLRIVQRNGRDASCFVEEFSYEEVEYLAFLEHERWCNERRECGWRYGPTKSVERRISNALVPYNMLSEANKEYNRAHAREIPHLLASVGLGIVHP